MLYNTVNKDHGLVFNSKVFVVGSNQSCYFQDKDTREFIYDFIEKHGGVDAALMEEDTRTGTTPPPSQISETGEEENC